MGDAPALGVRRPGSLVPVRPRSRGGARRTRARRGGGRGTGLARGTWTWPREAVVIGGGRSLSRAARRGARRLPGGPDLSRPGTRLSSGAADAVRARTHLAGPGFG